MQITLIMSIISLPILVAVVAGLVYLFRLLVKALKTYIRTAEVRGEKQFVRKTLGENIKEHRQRCKMTQEFVAESVGVSRQAVSKWENGTSDPSTANLLALAKLFGITAEELLQGTQE